MFFNKIKKWLEDMARRNDERFGNKKLDCCNMNRQQNNHLPKDKLLRKNKTVMHKA